MVIEVEDRAVEGGTREIRGDEVAGAHGGFIDLVGGGRVPFHRVRAVRRRSERLYERGPARRIRAGGRVP